MTYVLRSRIQTANQKPTPGSCGVGRCFLLFAICLLPAGFRARQLGSERPAKGRAAEIQLRTGWHAERCTESEHWCVFSLAPQGDIDLFRDWVSRCYKDTPWEALIAAEEWAKANGEV